MEGGGVGDSGGEFAEEDTGLIEGVMEEFNGLWEGERCRRCGRKEVCPVPLEEPEL